MDRNGLIRVVRSEKLVDVDGTDRLVVEYHRHYGTYQKPTEHMHTFKLGDAVELKYQSAIIYSFHSNTEVYVKVVDMLYPAGSLGELVHVDKLVSQLKVHV